MALWVDKHRPRSLQALSYHPKITARLRALAVGGDFPHLLVYGASGVGKKTRIIAALKELYGPGVNKIKVDSRVFQTSSNRKLEFNVVSSIYHMEITPSDMGNNDRVIIQELLKEVAQTQQVDLSAKKRFKVVIINEADSLTRDAQAALRRTMEKYSPNLRLILIANTTSNIIAPIRSRTLLMRVPAPDEPQIVSILQGIAKKERVALPPVLAERLAHDSGRNLRKAVLMLEAVVAQTEKLADDTAIPPPDWEVVIASVVDDVIQEHSAQRLMKVRAKFYELLSHCIPPEVVLKTLLFKLLPRVDPDLRAEIIHWAAFYEHRLHLGSKAIFHLEAFVAKVMRMMEAYVMGLGL
ncbi:P-loop containing nucleoside triphosphate hydrolase protein [Dipodascopsis tothii]|uniref:P-loop containing nucleoside triphosphate hydrolase protein n=1 Tax=Dipodascopsis tothii TaxID=44089 RepID=UPI0034CF50C0